MQQTMELPGFEIPASPAVSAISKALREEFPARVQTFVLTHLRRHGATSGEDLVDALILAGIKSPGGDARSFGPAIQACSRQQLIEPYGDGTRRKGNRTRGATIWRITAKGLKA